MKNVDVKPDAAALAHADMRIEAPLETVWALLTDLAHWPQWNRNVTKMLFQGELKPGEEFTWWAAGSKIRSRLELVEAPRRIVWSGRTMGIDAVHVWELQAVDGVTLVSTRESFDGLLVRLFPKWMKAMLEKSLQQGLEDLKLAAEARGRSPQAGTARGQYV